jgi:acetylornithine aminotransferase
VLTTIENDDLLANADALGRRIRDDLNKRLGNDPGVRDIRGRGLMIGVELDRPCGELVAAARERGVLINVAAERVIRLLPPLILTPEQTDMIIDTVASIVTDVTEQSA